MLSFCLLRPPPSLSFLLFFIKLLPFCIFYLHLSYFINLILKVRDVEEFCNDGRGLCWKDRWKPNLNTVVCSSISFWIIPVRPNLFWSLVFLCWFLSFHFSLQTSFFESLSPFSLSPLPLISTSFYLEIYRIYCHWNRQAGRADLFTSLIWIK